MRTFWTSSSLVAGVGGGVEVRCLYMTRFLEEPVLMN
jgi:hypothetical protein